MPVSLTPPMTIYPNNQTITEMYRVDRSSGEFSDLENDEAIYGGGKVKYSKNFHWYILYFTEGPQISRKGAIHVDLHAIEFDIQ